LIGGRTGDFPLLLFFFFSVTPNGHVIKRILVTQCYE